MGYININPMNMVIRREKPQVEQNITLRIYTHSQDPERKEAYSDKNPEDTLEEQRTESKVFALANQINRGVRG